MDVEAPLWRDRHHAGLALARCRVDLRPPTLLLALPRGGVPVAAAMADELGLKLATWSVRKVADPSAPEVAVGAIAPGGVTVWRNGGSAARLEALARQRGWLAAQQLELRRRQQQFGDPLAKDLQGQRIVVVDDGVATGMTLKAALMSLRLCRPEVLELAVPVADRQVLAGLQQLVDRTTVLASVSQLIAVGLWYEHFEQCSDGEVLSLLDDRRWSA